MSEELPYIHTLVRENDPAVSDFSLLSGPDGFFGRDNSLSAGNPPRAYWLLPG